MCSVDREIYECLPVQSRIQYWKKEKTKQWNPSKKKGGLDIFEDVFRTGAGA